jgi:hypothetical protein
MAMGMNFGYAYRLATVRAIVDGLRECVSPGVKTELLCDVSHNGITEELLGASAHGWRAASPAGSCPAASTRAGA